MSSACGSQEQKGADPCPICLEPVKKEAYLDSCFHSFCYPCIVRWFSVVSKKHSQPQSTIKCPLCKAESSSIIHGFDGEYFQRHYLSQGYSENRLSSAHNFRLQWYNSDSGVPCTSSDISLYWKGRRYLRKNRCTESWLRREIQVLTQEKDVEIIVHHLHGAVETFFRRQQEGTKAVMPDEKRKAFRGLLSDAARPFLLGRTDRFVDEMEIFLALGLNIDAYDAVCMQSLADISTSTE